MNLLIVDGVKLAGTPENLFFVVLVVLIATCFINHQKF